MWCSYQQQQGKGVLQALLRQQQQQQCRVAAVPSGPGLQAHSTKQQQLVVLVLAIQRSRHHRKSVQQQRRALLSKTTAQGTEMQKSSSCWFSRSGYSKPSASTLAPLLHHPYPVYNHYLGGLRRPLAPAAAE